MFDMISIGDTMQDVFLEMDPANAHLHKPRHESTEICFTYADKIPVKAKSDAIGGNSANAAIAFARLGFRTAIYTHIGSDTQGERIIKEFKKNNVSTDYIITDHGLESNYNTVINLNAERTILIYHVHRHFALPRMEAAKWIYLSSMGQGFDVILDDLVKYLQQYKAKLVYQPGTFQLSHGIEQAKKILKHTEVFAVNKEEAERYLGKPAGSDFKELLDSILALGPTIAMISDGTKGAYASNGKEYWYLGIIKEAPRNEATGAGDSFTSGFTAALATGEDLSEALRWGQAESSSVIQHIGPQAGLLYRKQLAQLLADHPDLKAIPLSSL